MKRKFWRKIVPGAAAVLLAALFLTGNYLVNFTLVRQNGVSRKDTFAGGAVKSAGRSKLSGAAIQQQKERWLARAVSQAAEVTSQDGLTLRGSVFKANSHRWVIVVHGYSGQRADMYGLASFYALRGWNILAPDLRAHGQSEGNYIGMGWPDRQDLLKWLDFVIERDERAEIILHGISMGAATVMMAAGEKLPPQVKGVIEDCGYTSVWDIFSDEWSYLFHLPDFPALYLADLTARIRAGYGFREASALSQVAKSEVPILFIHGAEDGLVHTDMAYELYAACRSPKDLLVVEGARHGQSYLAQPEQYFETVFDFIDRECIWGAA